MSVDAVRAHVAELLAQLDNTEDHYLAGMEEAYETVLDFIDRLAVKTAIQNASQARPGV